MNPFQRRTRPYLVPVPAASCQAVITHKLAVHAVCVYTSGHAMAERVSGAVRSLDQQRARVQDTLSLVEEVIELRGCTKVGGSIRICSYSQLLLSVCTSRNLQHVYMCLAPTNVAELILSKAVRLSTLSITLCAVISTLICALTCILVQPLYAHTLTYTHLHEYNRVCRRPWQQVT